MKTKIILSAACLLSACSLGLYSEPLYTTPDGNTVYQATCNGTRRSIGDCYRLAAQQCFGNFEIINQDKENTGSVDSFSGKMNFSDALNTYYNGGYTAKNLISRNIIYRCKEIKL